MFKALIFVALIWLACLLRQRKTKSGRKVIAVVVIGDLGRSPRMQLHALALAKAGYQVYLVGLTGSECKPEVIANPYILRQTFQPTFADQYLTFTRCPYILRAILKIVQVTVQLFSTLFFLVKPDGILVQNPPAIPAFFVSYAVARLRGICFIIDWHNYGWSILQCSNKHPLLVSAYRWIEKTFGQRADASLCVSDAMKNDLQRKDGWIALRNEVITIHDRPTIKPKGVLALEERHCVYMKYLACSSFVPDLTVTEDHETEKSMRELSLESQDFYLTEKTLLREGNNFDKMVAETLLTSCKSIDENRCTLQLKSSRPAVIITSTSWTEDEDFSILFEALCLYEKAAATNSKALPNLCLIITGRGAMRLQFSELVKNQKWKHVKVLLTFVSYSDYFRLLASADMGISLHTSSSGLDLPMKIIDMVRVNLPVLAYSYPTLKETFNYKIGRLFSSATELNALLCELFVNFPSDPIRALKKNLMHYEMDTWDTVWSSKAAVLFHSLVH